MAPPGRRSRDLATEIGITERASQRIVHELEQDGYLPHKRVGRRNHYKVNRKAHLRHALGETHDVRELLEVFLPDD